MRVLLVREAGVEPARPCEHWHLKPASLPIPPLARVVCCLSSEYDNSTAFANCQHLFSFFFCFFHTTPWPWAYQFLDR